MAVTDAMGLDLFDGLDDYPQFIVPFEDESFSGTCPGRAAIRCSGSCR